jgi:hypothetical protein
MLSADLLSVYLNNHLGAATGGVELSRRVRDAHAGTEDGEAIAQLVGEIVEDRTSLRRIMARVNVSEKPAYQALMWASERLGRLKPNGYLLARSPLSDVVELEAMRAGVAAKRNGWQTLLGIAVREDRLDRAELESLVERADSQLDRLHDIHLRMVRSHADEIVRGHES